VYTISKKNYKCIHILCLLISIFWAKLLGVHVYTHVLYWVHPCFYAPRLSGTTNFCISRMHLYSYVFCLQTWSKPLNMSWAAIENDPGKFIFCCQKVVHLFSYIIYIASFFLFKHTLQVWHNDTGSSLGLIERLAFFNQLLLKENSTLGLRAFCIEDPYQSC